MKRRQFVLRTLRKGLLGAFTSSSVGCGTLLHNERVNQPHSNQIDWRIAALNGLGLILFFVPGVIAFVVDFYTGAIYLPYGVSHSGPRSNKPESPADKTDLHPANAGPNDSNAEQMAGLRRVDYPADELNLKRIEQIATEHARQPVILDSDQTRLSVLESIEKFKVQRKRHEADWDFGQSVQAFFEKWS